MPPPPADKYSVIVVDAPWPAADAPNRFQALARIMALGPHVLTIAADNCTLWMWAPNNYIAAAVRMIELWGFEYRTIFTHIDERPRPGRHDGRSRNHLLGSTEQILVAARGKPFFSASTHHAFTGKAPRNFSRPIEFYLTVEKSTPSIRRYAEFFGHGPSRGYWDRFDADGQQVSRSHSSVSAAAAAAHNLDLTNK